MMRKYCLEAWASILQILCSEECKSSDFYSRYWKSTTNSKRRHNNVAHCPIVMMTLQNLVSVATRIELIKGT